MGALRLRKIEIQGFRSFGSVRQTIDLPDTVTALWGGNSQGKTSFAEAMEFLITGQIARRELLASAKDEFSDSLRNAHIAPAIAVIVEAEFVCPDGKHRRLKRTLVEDYKGSSVCSSKVEIDGKPCAEADLESQIGRGGLNRSTQHLPNATAHCAKWTIANPPAIAVIAGHAIERAARHLKLCRPMGVSTANHQMPPAAGRACKR